VRQACYALGVSPSGYYDWKARAPSARPVRRAWLTDLIGQVREASYGTYGQPRVHAELQRAHGVMVGRNTVALLMRRAGVSGLPLGRRAKQVPSQKTVTDLVTRQFTAEGPNRLWVTDITEHPTRDGKLYCCVVTGVFSRGVVGWGIDSTQRADLATNALGMATGSRRPFPGPVIHGDHGSSSPPGLLPPGRGTPDCCPRPARSAIPATTRPLAAGKIKVTVFPNGCVASRHRHRELRSRPNRTTASSVALSELPIT
jgi:putative transposase